jgi:hypothetical protein
MKTLFAVLSLVFAFCIFVPYFIDMWNKTAKPHIFTWITWTILTPIGFIVSFNSGGAGGSWIFLFQGCLCFFVVLYAIKHGEKNITLLDWFSFISALVLALFYIFTHQAVVSAILAASIDVLGYVPTFRKSYSNPNGEPALTYLLAATADILAILAIKNYNLATTFYPVVLFIINAALVYFLLARRKSLKGIIE